MANIYYDNEETDRDRWCMLSIIVDNEPGVLARVVGLFSGRGYNVESLTVSSINAEHTLSRITIKTSGTPTVIEQIKAQIGRLIPVHSVSDLALSETSFVAKEIALIKIVATGSKRREALRLADIFKAQVVDATLRSFVFQLTGGTKKVDTFVSLLRSLGTVDLARSGAVALARGLSVVSDDPTLRQIVVSRRPATSEPSHDFADD